VGGGHFSVVMPDCLLLQLLALCALCTLSSGLSLGLRRGLAAAGAGLAGLIGQGSLPSWADTRIVGNIETSGLVFKDTLKVSTFSDPKLPSVHLYLADFERPITEKLASNPFSDPSSSSLSCVASSPSTPEQIARISGDEKGEEVFSESKNLIFKSIKVRRLYDKQTNTAIYASYSTRFDKSDDSNLSRYKASLCAVNLGPQ
jgi:CreA protein